MNKVITKGFKDQQSRFLSSLSSDMAPGEMDKLKSLLDEFFTEEKKEPEHQVKDEKKIAAGIVFQTPTDRVLLLRRVPEEKNYGGHWGLPGGKAEPGESPADAAMREAKEETGYNNDFDKMSELGVVDTPNGMQFTTFLVKEKEEFKPVFTDKEHDDYQWASLDNLPEPIHPGVKETLMKLKGTKGANDSFAFDKDSVRSFDSAGRMHVAAANISKAAVNPYFGKEIPGFEALGLDPEKIYQMFRCPEELAKAADSFNNIQILKKHIPVSADDHQPDEIAGTTGTGAAFNAPFLVNELTIWSQEAIDLIESGEQQELSCGYAYVPVMEPGVFEGDSYDGKMTNIEGNHVALVEKGRAGPEVVVGDEAIQLTTESKMNKPLSRTAVRVQAALSAYFMPKIALDSQLKFSTALSTGLQNINLKALKKKNFRDAIVKMAKDAAEPMMTPEAKKAGAGPDDVIMRVLDMVEGQVAAEPNAEEMDEAPPMVEKNEEGEEEEDGEQPKGAGWKKKVMDALMEKGMDEAGCKAIMDMMPEDEEEAMDDKDLPKPGEGKTAEDEEEEKKKEKAMDAALKLATKQAEENTMKRLQAIRVAEREVHSLIGDVSITTDSADEIYKTALKAYDVSTEGVHASAFPAMVRMLAKQKGERHRTDDNFVGDAALSLEDREAFDKQHGIVSRRVRQLGAA